MLLSLFSNNLLPIFLAAAAGFALGRLLHPDPRTISRLTFFVFSPCLVFKLLTDNDLGGADVLGMFLVAVLVAVLTGLIALAVGRLLRLPRPLLAALVLSAMFGNAGNYGLSLNLFAFGEEGLAFASIYFVASGLMVYTFGIIVASMGNVDLRKSILNLFRFPTLYAVLLALGFNALGGETPLPLTRTIDLFADAAIPTMLILLGLQLERVEWRGRLRALAAANVLRLLVSPLIALGLALALRLQGPAFQAGIAESAMPTAVMVTVLATEFDVEPSFTTAVVTTTTLLSPLTLTPLLAFLIG
ncbi:MAG: AEC family transporter [Anaerolineae bacterium]|nr:MAG: AEC family transporter [Anaerolineae bacterium]